MQMEIIYFFFLKLTSLEKDNKWSTNYGLHNLLIKFIRIKSFIFFSGREKCNTYKIKRIDTSHSRKTRKEIHLLYLLLKVHNWKIYVFKLNFDVSLKKIIPNKNLSAKRCRSKDWINYNEKPLNINSEVCLLHSSCYPAVNLSEA